MATIDIADQVGAIKRSIRNGERDGRPLRSVVAERTFRGSLEDVWDALTSADRIPRWLMPISGDLRLGGRYQLEGNAGGEITDCEPPNRLGVTWEYQGDVTWVDAVLAEVDSGVHLTIEHSAHPNPEFEAMGFGPGAVGVGWDLMLLGLALHIEASGDLNHPSANPTEWGQSDDGKDFMTRSGDSWGEADIASGTAPDAARRAAALTIQAYTGS